jgi:hypothetical protein
MMDAPTRRRWIVHVAIASSSRFVPATSRAVPRRRADF